MGTALGGGGGKGRNFQPMLHGGVNCQEDIERVVTRTTIRGDSREKGDTTINVRKGEQSRGTVKVSLEVGSD